LSQAEVPVSLGLMGAKGEPLEPRDTPERQAKGEQAVAPVIRALAVVALAVAALAVAALAVAALAVVALAVVALAVAALAVAALAVAEQGQREVLARLLPARRAKREPRVRREPRVSQTTAGQAVRQALQGERPELLGLRTAVDVLLRPTRPHASRAAARATTMGNLGSTKRLEYAHAPSRGAMGFAVPVCAPTLGCSTQPVTPVTIARRP